MENHLKRIIQTFLMGILLSVAIVLVHKLCYGIFLETDVLVSGFTTMILFGAVILLFLKSPNIYCLLGRGFTALFLMFVIELAFFPLSVNMDSVAWLLAYLFGLFGAVGGVVFAIVLTLTQFRFHINNTTEEGTIMQTKTKRNLLIYTVVSAVSFSYLVLPEYASASIPLFTLLQAVCLWFCVPNRKRLWVYIPIFVLSLNSFLSGNMMWRASNLFLCLVLYSAMFLDFSIRDTSLRFLSRLAARIILPFRYMLLPLHWGMNLNQEKAPVVKRVLRAVAITVPCLTALILLLSAADLVFSKGTSEFFRQILDLMSFNVILKIVIGAAAGLYLFGVVFAGRLPFKKAAPENTARRGDLILINILLASILLVYTIFVVIQFKYLFVGSALPYGLTYTEYARKGFFELLALTGVNIIVILLIVHLTKAYADRWKQLSNILCSYLCAVTLILLASSFYRMWLYNADDGLTRLRFMVFGFLIFEAAGLLVTFWYIFKPKFNIVSVYLAIGLTYYLALNIVPMDYFIARNQIEKYVRGERQDIAYVFALSSDAAEPIYTLLQEHDDPALRNAAGEYFANAVWGRELPARWQRFNLSQNRCVKLSQSLDSAEDNR